MTLNELIDKAKELDVDFDKIITLYGVGGVDIEWIDKGHHSGGLLIYAF